MRINEIFKPPVSVVEFYSGGNCMWLALAFNRRFGWPIMAQIRHDPVHGHYIAHAYNQMPDGREIDILGPQEKVDVFSPVDETRQFSPSQMIAFIEQETFQGERSISQSEIQQKLNAADWVIDQYDLTR